jgi:hypothetical protein
VKTYILSGGGGQIAVAHVGVAESLSHREKKPPHTGHEIRIRERERERERACCMQHAYSPVQSPVPETLQDSHTHIGSCIGRFIRLALQLLDAKRSTLTACSCTRPYPPPCIFSLFLFPAHTQLFSLPLLLQYYLPVPCGNTCCCRHWRVGPDSVVAGGAGHIIFINFM